MALTPLDAEKARFRQVFRGYAREEVEAFRAAVIAALEEQIGRVGQLANQIAELERQLKRYQESEELLKNSVVLAQRTCDELIAAAHKKADAIRQDARSDGQRLRLELAELRAQREQFEYAFHGLLSGFLHRLEQGNPRLAPARGETRQLESAAGREEIDHEDLSVPADSEPGVGPAEMPTPAADAPVTPGTAGSAGSQSSASAPARSPEIPDVPLPQPPRVSAVPTVRHDATSGGAGASHVHERDADIAEFAAAVAAVEVPAASEWPEPREAAAADGPQGEVNTDVPAEGIEDSPSEDSAV